MNNNKNFPKVYKLGFSFVHILQLRKRRHILWLAHIHIEAVFEPKSFIYWIYGLNHLTLLLLNAMQVTCATSKSHTKRLMLVFCLLSTLPLSLFRNADVETCDQIIFSNSFLYIFNNNVHHKLLKTHAKMLALKWNKTNDMHMIVSEYWLLDDHLHIPCSLPLSRYLSNT